LLIVIGALVASFVTASAARPSPQVQAKQAEAEQVLAQVQQMDAQLELVIESYNAAQVRLDQVKAEQKVNAHRLEIARANYRAAQATLEQRLIALYTSDEQGVLEILLGAGSLGELLDRLDTVNRVSEQDARVIGEVKTFRSEIKRRETELREARAAQERIVAERAAKRNEIEGQLAERQRLLASIKDEIAQIRAAEAKQQERLKAQAQERLASSDNGSGGGGGGSGGGGNPPPGRYGGVVGIAMQYLGIPYRYGGASPSTGFDCSGFVMYVYAQVGVSLPHNAAMQYGYGSSVSRANLQPGDLVFFNGLGHNGIYIGGNQFIHSPHTGDVVKISSITGWYASTYYGARRL
jgi:cell wall-associated NlpC family hydrolase